MKYIDVRSASLDELAFAYGQALITVEGYKALGIDAPETLAGQLKDIKREADDRVRAEREALLKKLQARREAMRTPDEKRATLDAQIAELSAKVA